MSEERLKVYQKIYGEKSQYKKLYCFSYSITKSGKSMIFGDK